MSQMPCPREEMGLEENEHPPAVADGGDVGGELGRVMRIAV